MPIAMSIRLYRNLTAVSPDAPHCAGSTAHCVESGFGRDLSSLAAHVAVLAARPDAWFTICIAPEHREVQAWSCAFLRDYGALNAGLFVSETQRGKGLASLLLNAELQALSKMGIPRIEAVCNALNRPAQRAFKRVGYRFMSPMLTLRFAGRDWCGPLNGMSSTLARRLGTRIH